MGNWPAAIARFLFPADRHHAAGFHAEIGRRLPARGRVLDLGCGSNAELAAYRTPGREVWGADFDAHPDLRHPDWFRLLEPDGTIPFPADSFDVVAAVMVLEHVADPDAFLREVARVLRPGGYFVGHTVSGGHYVTWLRRGFGLLPHRFNQWLVRRLYGRAEADTFPAYYRLNRRGPIARAGGRAGLGPPVLARYADAGYFRFAAPLYAAAVVVDRVLALVASGWGRLYLTVTLEKPPAPAVPFPLSPAAPARAA